MSIYDDRTTKFNNKEFKNLSRTNEGRIIDLAECFIFIKDAQVGLLHCDDYSYYEELMEELRIILHDC